MKKKWIVQDGQTLMWSDKYDSYVLITLSPERINEIYSETINEFVRENKPKRTKSRKTDKEYLFYDDDVEVTLENNDPRLNRLAEETMLIDNELREFQERFED